MKVLNYTKNVSFRKHLFLFVVAVFCFVISLQVGYAQGAKEITKVGTTVAQFLKIDVSPRSAAMGGTYTAIANDASALFWNSAGLSHLSRNELIVSHTNWIADLKYEFGGVVIPIGDLGTFGASVMSLSTEDMDVRTVDQPEGTGEKFNVSDIAAGISYARNLTDRFSIGFTGKYIREAIWHMNASTLAFDLGTLYKTGFYGLTIGMSITNFGGKMKFEGRDAISYINVNPGNSGTNDKVVSDIRMDEWAIPLGFRVGLAVEPITDEIHHLTIAVDALHPNDNTESVNVGAEYVFEDLIALRGGYKALFRRDSEEGLTLGGGIRYPLSTMNLKVDYSYSDFGRLNSVQRFSFGIEF